MEKNISINIAIDGVPLNQLESIQEKLEALFEGFEDKRITMIMQDAPLVKFN